MTPDWFYIVCVFVMYGVGFLGGIAFAGDSPFARGLRRGLSAGLLEDPKDMSKETAEEFMMPESGVYLEIYSSTPSFNDTVEPSSARITDISEEDIDLVTQSKFDKNSPWKLGLVDGEPPRNS